MANGNKTDLEKNHIPILWQYSFLTISMYTYVRAATETLYTLSVKDAIEKFMESYGISHDDYNAKSAAQTYARINKQLRKEKSK